MQLLKNLLKWTAVSVVLVATVVALAVALISHRGRTELAAVKAELVAEGEKLTLSELLPAPVPDHLNLFEDSIWRPTERSDDSGTNQLKQTPLALADSPLTDSERAQGMALFGPEFFAGSPGEPRLDVARFALVESYSRPRTEQQALWYLEILKPFEPLMIQIEGLLDRPFARFRQSDDLLNNEVYEFGGGLFYVAKVLKPRATAQIALGNSEEALSDVLILARLIPLTASEPVLFMEFLRVALAGYLDELIREGIRKRVWSDSQLAMIDAALQQVDLIRGIANGFRAERGLSNQYLEEIYLGERRVDRGNLPGLFRNRLFGMELWRAYLHVYGPSDQALLNRDIQSLVELLDNSREAGIDEDAIRKLIVPNDTGVLRDNFFYLLGGNVRVAIEVQISLDQARFACALERYRLRHGTYPAELSLLVPQFLPSLPVDRYSLAAMKYKLMSPDHFELTARSGEEAIRWSNLGEE